MLLGGSYGICFNRFFDFPSCGSNRILPDTKKISMDLAFDFKLLFLYVFGCKNARVDYYDDNNNIFGRNMA